MSTQTIPRRRRLGAAALVTASITALSLAAGTSAVFTDTAEVAAGSFESGHLEIDLADPDGGDSISLTASDMAPGDEVGKAVTVMNTGTLPLEYTITVEQAPGSGTLGEVLDVAVHDGVQELSEASEDNRVLYQQGLPTLETEVSTEEPVQLLPGDEQEVFLYAGLQLAAEREYVDDSASLIFTFDAEHAIPLDTRMVLHYSVENACLDQGVRLPVSQTTGGTIDWGDGSEKEPLIDNALHRYASQGDYIVTIDGTFGVVSGIQPSGIATSMRCLTKISHWGDTGTTNVNLSNGRNIEYVAEPPPTVTSMSHMFVSNPTFNQDISHWDVSRVTAMTQMFQGATSFNQDLSRWDVKNVRSMTQMFQDATSFNQDLSGWDTSSVIAASNFATNTPAWVLPKPQFN